MDRDLVISSDCHAGLPPEQYRDYLDPQYCENVKLAPSEYFHRNMKSDRPACRGARPKCATTSASELDSPRTRP
ncbi:MAG: hypothetical protein V3T64_05890, partial [Myxococcota bacterium]